MAGWIKQRLLGSGSYGKVYLAVTPENMEIAVKSATATAVKCTNSLKREGEFLNSLRGCPYIVRCFGEDTSVENGVEVYNLLLEYAPGGTLSQLIDSGREGMPESDVAWYAYQLLKGIHHVHNLGFVHCDLKPDNVLVFPRRHRRNSLKLCDFGLAKKAAGRNIFGDCHRGTSPYAPPESLTSKQYAPPKDIWALGCTVVEMITGKSMWELNDENDSNNNTNLLLSSVSAAASPSAMDFLTKCFQVCPQCRWTAERLLAHPFIVHNNHWFEIEEREEEDDDEGSLNNPFGCPEWSCSKNLFTEPPPSLDNFFFSKYICTCEIHAL